MNAVFSALRGGPRAARFASEAAPPEVDYEEVKRLKKYIFAPMKREKGFLPADAIYSVQDVVCKIKYNLRGAKTGWRRPFQD